MATFSTDLLPEWQAERLLLFLNKATTPDEIALNPDDSIGATIAQRIFDRRNELGNSGFEHIGQLSDIDGFGEIRFDELAEPHKRPIADVFVEKMLNEVLTNSFHLQHFSENFPTRGRFELIAENDANLNFWVIRKLRNIYLDFTDLYYPPGVLNALVLRSYVQTHYNARQDSYELALWFNRIDHDDDISFDELFAATSILFNSYDRTGEVQLRMYRGFDVNWVYRAGRVALDLPIVINYPEQTISLLVTGWGTLMDQISAIS